MRNLSMAAVAAHLGVPVTSLYSYVDGIEDLERAAADELLGPLRVTDGPDLPARDVAIRTGLALYECVAANAGLADLYLTSWWRALLAFEEAFASALARRGLREAEAVWLTDAVVTATMGAIIQHEAWQSAAEVPHSARADQRTTRRGMSAIGPIDGLQAMTFTLRVLVEGTLAEFAAGRHPWETADQPS